MEFFALLVVTLVLVVGVSWLIFRL